MSNESMKFREKDYKKALRLVKEKKVKKYIFKPSNVERWVVEGKTGKYIVLPNLFCQCEDFYISVIIKKKKERCYHLIAQSIAEQLKSYDEIYLSDDKYIEFMRKITIKY
ncbi:MAG: hypothetical protein QW743_05940 [Candidatus Methanomethylicia archaeon]